MTGLSKFVGILEKHAVILSARIVSTRLSRFKTLAETPQPRVPRHEIALVRLAAEKEGALENQEKAREHSGKLTALTGGDYLTQKEAVVEALESLADWEKQKSEYAAHRRQQLKDLFDELDVFEDRYRPKSQAANSKLEELQAEIARGMELKNSIGHSMKDLTRKK